MHAVWCGAGPSYGLAITFMKCLVPALCEDAFLTCELERGRYVRLGGLFMTTKIEDTYENAL